MAMKSSTGRVTRVAIAQFAPVYHNKTASLTKALELVQGAASRGAALIAFGESWLSGYPAWLDAIRGVTSEIGSATALQCGQR